MLAQMIVTLYFTPARVDRSVLKQILSVIATFRQLLIHRRDHPSYRFQPLSTPFTTIEGFLLSRKFSDVQSPPQRLSRWQCKFSCMLVAPEFRPGYWRFEKASTLTLRRNGYDR